MTTFTKKANCVRDQLVCHLFRAFPFPHSAVSGWPRFAAILLGQLPKYWVTALSHQSQQTNTFSVNTLLYFAPLLQVSNDGFLVSAVSLNSALKAFKAGAATSFPQPGRMAGWLLHPLRQGPVHSSPNAFFKHISEVIQSQLQGHSSLWSCFPSPSLHVLLKRSVDSI